MSLQLVIHAVVMTLVLFAASLFCGAVLAAAVCALRMSSNPVLRYAATFWIGLVRGVPSLVWLFIVFFGISIGGQGMNAFTAALLTFALISSAHLGEAYRTGFEAVGQGQFEAAKALAMPRLANLKLILMPQALPVTCASGISYAIHLLKDTALASVIGVTEITFFANDMVQRGGDGLVIFLVAGVLYLLLSLPLSVLARAISNRFRLTKGQLA